LEEAISKLQPALTNTTAAGTSATKATTTTTQASHADTEAIIRKFRLPEIKVLTFDGNPLEWGSFGDLFETMFMKLPRFG